MATITEVTGFKVVNTASHKLPNRRGTINFVRSALLNASPATIDYSKVLNDGQPVYTGPKLAGTPIIAFDDAQAALDFAANKTGCQVYKLHGYARLVLPITAVLQLRLGWTDQAPAFWKAVEAGGELKDFKVHTAPAHSIAIFGVITLQERVFSAVEVEKIQPAYGPVDEDVALDPQEN